jgi:uncharacterized membrane protein YbhN (UPF0104 family)
VKNKSVHLIAPLLAVGLLVVSGLVLQHQLRTYNPRDIWSALSGIPLIRLFAAAGLTVLSFSILTGYDTLGMRYVRHRMPYPKIAMASFTSYALSNTVGFTLISGVPVRYYFYASWGLPTSQISKLVAFCVMTGWIGLLTLCGLVLTVGNDSISEVLTLQPSAAHLIGALLLVLVAAYLILSFAWSKPVRVFNFEIPHPGPGLAISQLILSSADWIVVSAVLYTLLPPMEGLSYPVLLGIFMLGQSVGSVSQVPGGLGVFEAAMLMMITGITGEDTAPQVLSGLVAYRGIYYLLPFVTAGFTFGCHGLWTHGRRLGNWIFTGNPPGQPPPRHDLHRYDEQDTKG